MASYQFPVSHRLREKKLIDTLFSRGKHIKNQPLQVIFMPHPGATHQVLVSVSKKKFARATVRNLIKRRLREAYRTEGHPFLIAHHKNVHFLLGIIYISRNIEEYQLIKTKLIESLSRMDIK